MKKDRLSEDYQKNFQRVNRPTMEAFESAASSYSEYYREFLPTDKNVPNT